jgi:hypothetical protein
MPSTLLITNEQKQLTTNGLSIRLMIQNLKAAIPTILKTISEKIYILIVGHSIQLLKSSRQPEVKPFATIADEEYDNLFLVTIKKNGTAKVRAMKYGTKK